MILLCGSLLSCFSKLFAKSADADADADAADAFTAAALNAIMFTFYNKTNTAFERFFYL